MVREEIKTEWRSRDVSRVEGFSDAVFGFAVTLLIVALEVPRTSGELLETMRGFGGFLVTFAILFSIWYKQFIYFRRYGLEDRTAIVLNGALLVVVLFFVYPLKFIFDSLVGRLLGAGKLVTLPDGRTVHRIEPQHYPALLAIYAFGLSAVFIVFTLLYRHAYNKRAELSLTPIETYDTRDNVRSYAWVAAMGAVIGTANLLTLIDGRFASDTGQLIVAGAQIAAVIGVIRMRVTRRKRRQKFLETVSAEMSPAG